MTRCVGCNNPLENYGRKRKPVTTWSGHMESIYTDVVVDFPRNEEEDLCKSCIRAINGISSDLNSEVNTYDAVENLLTDDFDRDSIDGAFEYTQRVYEGYD